jgi:hypothetical protein
MTDLVSFAGVEEQDMIGVGNGLIAAHMPQVNSAVRKYKVRRRGTLFFAAMTTLAGAPNVAQCDGVRAEQPRDTERRKGRHDISLYPLSPGERGKIFRMV